MDLCLVGCFCFNFTWSRLTQIFNSSPFWCFTVFNWIFTMITLKCYSLPIWKINMVEVNDITSMGTIKPIQSLLYSRGVNRCHLRLADSKAGRGVEKLYSEKKGRFPLCWLDAGIQWEAVGGLTSSGAAHVIG